MSEGDLPPGFIEVPSQSRPGAFSYYDTVEKKKYATMELAWAAHKQKKKTDKDKGDVKGPPLSSLPPGFTKVESQSRPGQFSYFCEATQKKYATLELAWKVYKEGIPVEPPPAQPIKRPSVSDPFKAKYLPRPSNALRVPGSGEDEETNKQKDPNFHAHAVAQMRNKENTDQRRYWRSMAAAHRVVPVLPPEKIPSPGKDGGFVDPEFPPLAKSIGETNSEDPTSRLRISPEERNSAVWIRLPHLIRMNCGLHDNDDVHLFDDIEPNDLTQGVVGDCWLLAAMACLAEFPEAIKCRITPQSTSPEGKYIVTLYDLTGKSWVPITVDDYVPCKYDDDVSHAPFRINDHGQRVYDGRYVTKKWSPLFANPNGNEMWCLLLEKAMAKFVGSYARIAGGHEPFALIAFTGYSQVYEFKRLPLDEDMSTAKLGEWERGWAQWNTRDRPTCGYRPLRGESSYPDLKLFDKIEQYDERNYLMAASITCFRPPKTPKDFFRKDGLVNGHAYSLISAHRVSLPSGQVIHLVQLRNPHGKGSEEQPTEWMGDWSDDSPLWERYPSVSSAVGFQKMNDGMFWMSFEDFAKTFDKIIVLTLSMGQSRSSASWKRRLEAAKELQAKASCGRLLLGVALQEVFESEEGEQQLENLENFQRMSVTPFDPFLNAPAWIRSDQKKVPYWETF